MKDIWWPIIIFVVVTLTIGAVLALDHRAANPVLNVLWKSGVWWADLWCYVMIVISIALGIIMVFTLR